MQVLYVDGDLEETRRVAAALEGVPGILDVVTETDPVEALDRLSSEDIDCLVAGHDLPVMDGVAFLESVRETRGDVPFVLFTGSGSEAVASRAISAGVTDYVRKGPEGGGLDALVDRIRSLSNDDGTATERAYDEAQFERFVEAFPDVVFVIDDEGRYVDVIASGQDSLLYDDPAELLGNQFHDLLPAETADRFLGAVRDALESGEQQRIEYQLEVQSGTRWFEARVGPLDAGGDTRTVFWIARDVTARKRREQEYEQIFNGVNDAITVFDPDAGEITEVNEAYRELLGYDIDRIRELGIEGLSATDEGYTGERGWELIREVAATGESETVEWQAEPKSGERVWLEVTMTPAEIGGERRVLSIQRDVTERRELERAYQDIFEGVSDGLVVHDEETGEILEVNQRYCEMTGYDREELIEDSIELIMPEDDPEYSYEDLIERIQKAREEGPQLFEFKGERKDGGTFIGDVNLRTIEIRGTERVLASVRDITARKRREREYEQIFNGVNDAIAIQDPETGEPVDANETFLDRLGYDDVDEIREEGLSGLSATESGYTEERAQELCRRVMETGESEVVEWQQETKDGERRWIEATIDSAVIQGEDRILSMQRDITERKRRQRELRESERRFRLIAERIDEVIYLANTDFSEVLYVNPAYETIWGRPTDELYDDARKFIEAIDPRDREEIESDIEAMVAEMQQGDPEDRYDFEYRIRQPGGEIRWVSARGYAVEMSGDERLVGIVEDITERKYREQRIEVFNRILRHNLRNQLDVIRSHAETLMDRVDDSHPDRIVAAVDELAAMGARARKIDRIMSMGNDASEVNLPETLGEVVEEITREQGAVEVATDLPASARLTNNEEALRTAVRSALENAIEYADSAVRLTVEDHAGGYTVVIDDDGPGIPEAELTPIEAGTETNLNHGRGLGLWQLRWGVDKLNGELSFDTNEGTTIRISVPDRAETARRN